MEWFVGYLVMPDCDICFDVRMFENDFDFECQQEETERETIYNFTWVKEKPKFAAKYEDGRI